MDDGSPPAERRSGRERRRGKRISLALDVAVPVVVRGPDGVERGLARNISEGGMLIEMKELPAIGAELEVTFSGLVGAASVTLIGEVRHHVSWQHMARGTSRTMRGVGLRFIEGAESVECLPAIPVTLH